MVNWGLTSRTWNAKTPHEKHLEYETSRLQAQEDRNHNIIKNERRLLNQVDSIAAESRYDAHKALRTTAYHNGMYPYGRHGSSVGVGMGVPYGMGATGVYGSPLLNRAAHLDLAYGGAGIGASPYLGAAGMGPARLSYTPATGYASSPYLGAGYEYGAGPSAYVDPAMSSMPMAAGNIQARRELAFAQQQRQRQALAQREMLARQQYAEIARVNQAYGLSPRSRAISTPYMGYAGVDPRVANTPFMGAGLRTPLVDPVYAADAAYEELAGLNVPPGSIRSRRLSTPFMSSADPLLF